MTVKIAVSLPDELVAEARRAVAAGRSASVSAYVAESLRERTGRELLAAIVSDLIDEFGEPSDSDRETARQVLYGDRGQRRRLGTARSTKRVKRAK